MNEREIYLSNRIDQLFTRIRQLREQLPRLEEARDYAYGNESSRVWYDRNVRVNEARREIKRNEKELAKQQRELKLIRETLGAGKETKIIPFSSESKQGREQVWELLAELAAG